MTSWFISHLLDSCRSWSFSWTDVLVVWCYRTYRKWCHHIFYIRKLYINPLIWEKLFSINMVSFIDAICEKSWFFSLVLLKLMFCYCRTVWSHTSNKIILFHLNMKKTYFSMKICCMTHETSLYTVSVMFFVPCISSCSLCSVWKAVIC